MSQADLVNLTIFTAQNYNGQLNFTLTAVVQENDGDINFATTDIFTVDFFGNADNSTASDAAPLKPDLDIGLVADGDNVGLEDQALVLVMNAREAVNETLNPVITVTISDIPAGFTIDGAIFNPLTGEYSADADDINAGLVTIRGPQDFSGFFNLTVVAVATSSRSTTGDEKTLTAFMDPVADGFSIRSGGPLTGSEDNDLAMNLTFGELDNYRSEIVYDGIFGSAFFYFRINITFATVFGYNIVLPGDADEDIFGFNMTGWYRIPFDDADNFILQFLENWHGKLKADVRVPIIEQFDDFDSDSFIMSSRYV